MSFAIQIEQLNKSYGQLQVLKNVNLTIKKGDFFALLGPNGAGKTTLIGILCSLVNKTSGTVKIVDKDIDVDFSGAKTYLGIVPQEFNFSVFETPQQILTHNAGYYGLTGDKVKRNIDKYLELLNLSDKKNVIAKRLSGGMKRRLMIARALIHDPEIIILDEPTAGVDIEIRRSTWEFLKRLNEEGKTIILTTHYLEEAENLCRNVAIIKKGEIIVNTSIKELLSRPQEQSYQIELKHEVNLDALVHDPALQITQLNHTTLKIASTKEISTNKMFEFLQQNNLEAINIVNNEKNLEDLFIELTNMAS